MVAQVAVAVVLLVGAGLLARALAGLQRMPLGFEPADVMTFRVPLAWDTDPARIAAVTARSSTACTRARRPRGRGRRSAAVRRRIADDAVVVDGVALPPISPSVKIAWRTASRGYFGAVGVPLRRRRARAGAVDAGDPRVAVVNERFVRLFLGGRDPIGLEVGGYSRGDAPCRATASSASSATCARRSTSRRRCRRSTCRPVRRSGRSCNVAARVDGDPARCCRCAGAGQPTWRRTSTVEDVQPLDARVAEALGEPRTRTWIVVAFAGVALLLAAIGLYGVLAGEVAATGEGNRDPPDAGRGAQADPGADTAPRTRRWP